MRSTHTINHFGHRLGAAVGSVLLLLGLSACHPGAADEDPAAERASLEANLEPQSVREITPELREERPTIHLVGEVRAFDTVTVSAEVAATAVDVHVEVGDPVSAGQPLVTLDRQTFELRLRQAEARVRAATADLELAGRELERKKDLVSDHTIPQATYDQAAARHDLAEAALAEAIANRDLAQHDFSRSIVRAPSAGTITRRTIVAGQWVDVGHALVEMAVGAKVKIAARVPSEWMLMLQGLDGFDFTVAVDEAPRHAELFSIDPVVKETSRSFEVVGTAPAEGLRPGMFANITLTGPNPQTTLWLPVSAVVTSDTPKVYQAVDGRVAVKRIQTGFRDDGMVQVVSGLEPGEKIIETVAGLSRNLPVEILE